MYLESAYFTFLFLCAPGWKLSGFKCQTEQFSQQQHGGALSPHAHFLRWGLLYYVPPRAVRIAWRPTFSSHGKSASHESPFFCSTFCVEVLVSGDFVLFLMKSSFRGKAILAQELWILLRPRSKVMGKSKNRIPLASSGLFFTINSLILWCKYVNLVHHILMPQRTSEELLKFEK